MQTSERSRFYLMKLGEQIISLLHFGETVQKQVTATTTINNSPQLRCDSGEKQAEVLDRFKLGNFNDLENK